MAKFRSMLSIAVLACLSLYVLNAVGDVNAWHRFIGGRRYLNVLWVALACYLFISKFAVDWELLLNKIRLLAPLCVVCVFLYFYHDHRIELGYLKYGLLLVLAASVVSKIEKFNLEYFFFINSVSCLLVFSASIYQVLLLDYVIPNGDINQNLFALMSLIVGSVSIFSVLYCDIRLLHRLFFLFCGALSVWVSLRTSCRTAFVTEIFLSVLFLIHAYYKFKWPINRVVIIFISVIGAMVLVILTSPSVTAEKFGVIFDQAWGYQELTRGETTSTSVGLRLAMWEAAFHDVIPQHLFFGVGDINELNRLELIVGSSIDREFLRTLQHFHNEGINTIVMGGLLLFVVCNWLLYQLYMEAKNEPVLLCLLVGYVAYGLTEVAFLHKQCFFVFVSMWLLYECAAKNERRKAQACTTS